MQKTDRLKLNLIEGSDNVDWAPLNENAQVLEAETGALREELTALDSLVSSGGRLCRIAAGTYQGTGTYGEQHKNTLSFDFVPAMVQVYTADSAYSFLTLLRGCGQGRYMDNSCSVTWGDRQVSWHSTSNAGNQLNYSGTTYHYVAFGFDQ